MNCSRWSEALLPVLPLVLGFAACPALAQPEPSQFQDAKPSIPKNDAVHVPYCGTVTEVTKDSITILWPREKTPQKFGVSETLAAGGIPKEPRLHPVRPGGYTVDAFLQYRLTDVKVGDVVFIYFSHLGDLNVCDHISIQKRPGGLVPPLPPGVEKFPKLSPEEVGKHPLKEIPYHEWKNAHWDWFDNNITYPAKFGKYRYFAAAPMPRPVPPRPPISP